MSVQDDVAGVGGVPAVTLAWGRSLHPRRLAAWASLVVLESEELPPLPDEVSWAGAVADTELRHVRAQRLDELRQLLADLDDEIAMVEALEASAIPVAALELGLRSAAAECRTAAFPIEDFQ